LTGSASLHILANYNLPLNRALYVQGVFVVKLFKYLGFGILSVVVFFIGIAIVTSINSVDKEAVFEPYITQAIPKLVTWEQSSYKELMSEKGFSSAKPEQWALALKKFSTLGDYKAMGVFELQNWKTLSPVGSPSITYAVYQVPVTFSSGLAHIQLTLQASEGKVEINKVKYLSDLLMQ
jgi:hypothetical protein